MPFKLFKKKKKYKYNDIEEVDKWTIKKRNKNLKNINPEILIEVLTENNEQFGHPDFLN